MGEVKQTLPYRDARRRGIGWNLHGLANMLETTARNNLHEAEEDWDYNSYDAKEFQLLKKVHKTMLWQVKVLRVIAKRMGVEPHEFQPTRKRKETRRP